MVVVLAVDVALMNSVIRVFDSIMSYLLALNFYLMNIWRILYITLKCRLPLLEDRLSTAGKEKIGDVSRDHTQAMVWPGIGKVKANLNRSSCLPYYSKDHRSPS